MTSDKKRMVYLAEETANITRLTLFPQYLTLLFEIDGLVLNDDRNLNNKARPFRTTFNRQIQAMEWLYGKQLRMPTFTRSQLMTIAEPTLEYYPARDRELIADRVCETVLVRRK